MTLVPWASSLSLKQSASGPLHLLFPIPGMPFSLLFTINPYLLFRFPFKYHLLTEALPDTHPHHNHHSNLGQISHYTFPAREQDVIN